MTSVVGRLAPTPSGALHLGNLCAFLAAWLSVRSQGGRLLLRIEDVDLERARPDIEASQRADLRWLGLEWDEETPRQSERDYTAALRALVPHCYFCACTRSQVRDAGGAHPESCRLEGHTSGAVRFHLPPGEVRFEDRRFGPQQVDPNQWGDPVLRRRDGLFTYNLAVVVDDARDGVTEVVRGADLLSFTSVQIRLWQALGCAPPAWLHAPLVLGPDGRKLSKSHGSLHVGALRDAGWRPSDVLRTVLPWLGLPAAATLHEAVARFDPAAGPRGPIRVLADDTAHIPRAAEGFAWRPDVHGDDLP